MSKENARKFCEAMNDKSAQEKWAQKAAGAKNDAEALDAAVSMAQEMGYDVTREELTDTLNELRAEQVKKTQQAVQNVQKLDEADLEDIAGGVYRYDSKIKNGSEYRIIKDGCRHDFTDTSCFAADACKSMAVTYYDCTGKYYAKGDEHNCWGNLFLN